MNRFKAPVVAPQPLAPEFRNELAEVARTDVELLAKLLDRDLGQWLS